MNLNQKSMNLMKKKSDKLVKGRILDNIERDASTDKKLGDTGTMVEFYQNRIEKYSQEKEELWGKLNNVMNEMKDMEEELRGSRQREQELRKEKVLLEDRVSELEVDMGRQVQQTQEKEEELRLCKIQMEELQNSVYEESAKNKEKNQELSEVIEKINLEKMEIEKNAEEINKRNTELQDFIDNQEISLGKKDNLRQVQTDETGE